MSAPDRLQAPTAEDLARLLRDALAAPEGSPRRMRAEAIRAELHQRAYHAWRQRGGPIVAVR